MQITINYTWWCMHSSFVIASALSSQTSAAGVSNGVPCARAAEPAAEQCTSVHCVKGKQPRYLEQTCLVLQRGEVNAVLQLAMLRSPPTWKLSEPCSLHREKRKCVSYYVLYMAKPTPPYHEQHLGAHVRRGAGAQGPVQQDCRSGSCHSKGTLKRLTSAHATYSSHTSNVHTQLHAHLQLHGLCRLLQALPLTHDPSTCTTALRQRLVRAGRKPQTPSPASQR